jgi:acyl carrier protein
MSFSRDEINTKLRVLLDRAKPGSSPAVAVTEATAFTDLQFDSLALIELANDVEEEFKLTIGDEDLVTLKTVGQLVDLVARRTGG